MARVLVWALFAVAIAAGVAMAGPSEGAVAAMAGWAVDTDALPGDDPMEPRIVERPELVLAGVVATGPDVSRMDFHALWERFLAESPMIKHQVDGAAYELHVQTEVEPAMHFTMAGVEVTDIEDLPAEVFVKVLPAATYAVFTTKFIDGFQGLYERIWAWLADSPYEADPATYDIQRYGARFVSPEDPESEVDVYVPVTLE